MELSRIKVCVCVCVYFLILSSKMGMKCISIIISHFSDQKLANLFMSMKKTRNVQFNLMSMSNDILFTFDHFHLNFLYFIFFMLFFLTLLLLIFIFIFFFGSFVCTIPLLWSLILISSLLVWFSSSDFLFFLASLYLREHFLIAKILTSFLACLLL